MSDGDHPPAHGEATGETESGGVWARSTAPQSPYTMRQVWVGLAVFVLLAIVAFVLPLALG